MISPTERMNVFPVVMPSSIRIISEQTLMTLDEPQKLVVAVPAT